MREAVAATTTASGGILHFISPGALDGFAVGALLSGLILLVMVPRLMRRAQPKGMFRDYFATPNDGGQFASALSALQERATAADLKTYCDVDTEAYELEELAEAVRKDATANDATDADAAAHDSAEPAGDDTAADDTAAAQQEPDEGDLSTVGNGGHRSKHRMTARPAWRIEVRRGQPRHAARSGALST